MAAIAGVIATVINMAMPTTSTPASATRLPLAMLRPGTSNTVSSAPKSETKMRREVHASRMIAGQVKRVEFSMKPRSVCSEFGSMWMTTPRSRYMRRVVDRLVLRAEEGIPGRHHEGEHRQQRKERVVGDGRRAIRTLVLLEAHEGAPGDAPDIADHPRFRSVTGPSL